MKNMYLGKFLCKNFEGYGEFYGIIVEKRLDSYYTVIYHDGDIEDIHEDDLVELLISDRKRIPSHLTFFLNKLASNYQKNNDEISNIEENYLNNYVLKAFPGHGMYYGKVISYTAPFYKVRYEDDDCEEYSKEDLAKYYVPSDKVPTKTKQSLDSLCDGKPKHGGKSSDAKKRKTSSSEVEASNSSSKRGKVYAVDPIIDTSPVRSSTSNRNKTNSSSRPVVPILPLHLIKVKHSTEPMISREDDDAKPSDSHAMVSAGSSPTTIPIDSTSTTIPIDSTPTTIPIDSTPTTIPIDSTPTTIPIDSIPTVIPIDPHLSQPDGKEDQVEKPDQHEAESPPAEILDINGTSQFILPEHQQVESERGREIVSDPEKENDTSVVTREAEVELESIKEDDITQVASIPNSLPEIATESLSQSPFQYSSLEEEENHNIPSVIVDDSSLLPSNGIHEVKDDSSAKETPESIIPQTPESKQKRGRKSITVNLGSFVKKYFPKYGNFYGIIVDYVEPYYKIIYEDDDEEEFSKSQVLKYRCVDECVPKHIAHELEKRYQNYLSAKPPTIHQVLDNQDEEVKHMTPPQNSEVKPPVPVPVPLVDYESDIEI